MEQTNFVDFQGDVKDDLFDILEEKWNVDPDCIEDIGNVKRWALPAPTRVITHQKPRHQITVGQTIYEHN